MKLFWNWKAQVSNIMHASFTGEQINSSHFGEDNVATDGLTVRDFGGPLSHCLQS
jgi:hypothetical protein